MQFKNPEILYLLFLLIIPILIHLFQLQKFQKVAFTNVKILKKIEQQTRKSSKLKKLLILLTRLLLFSFLILAFAQPYLKKENADIGRETYIYLDNSFSMQAKGESGALLQKAKNDLIENLPTNTEYIILITNNQIIKFKEQTDFKKEIINIDFYPIQKEWNNILLEVQNLNSENVKTKYDFLLISDFQKVNGITKEIFQDSLANYSFVQTLPAKIENITMDSVWVSKTNKENLLLNVRIKSYQVKVSNLSVSLFISDKLHGKTTVNIDKNEEETIEFNIPYKSDTNGYLSLNDKNLTFDNNLYFSIPNKEKTNVLAIGEAAPFLEKIYTSDDFNYTATDLNSLDYTAISNQQLIVINNIKQVPNSLTNALVNFINKEGNLVIIPAIDIEMASYNNLFKDLNIGEIKSKIDLSKSVSIINYKHPFFKNVFQKPITNFQYPTVASFFKTSFNTSSFLIQFEDKTDFITQINSKNSKIYWVAASLNSENSNFISSPLIVPVFYNFSLQNKNQEALFYLIGNKNEIIVKFKTGEQDVLHMLNNENDFIPLQSKTSKYTKIQAEIDPLTDGIYQIKHQAKTIKHVAYNYTRNESDLDYFNMDNMFPNAPYFKSVKSAITDLNDKNKNKNLWQLFIIFALLFLGLEVLFQKFLKY